MKDKIQIFLKERFIVHVLTIKLKNRKKFDARADEVRICRVKKYS